MTTSQQQIIIAMCAGEASGDLLGAHLIEALKRQYPNARFVGIGGARMKAEGFESLFEQEKLAVRGYFEVLSNLPEILSIRSSLIEELKFIRPQVFVGIDSPDFNLHVAAKLKAAGIPTLHYVSPSVWAWKAERVHKIVKQVNRVLCLFPMEPKLYEDAGGRALFVGHPLAQILPIDPDRQGAREVLKLDEHVPVIAIMPGSRVSEIEYMAPLFFQTAKLLLRDLPNAQFIVPYPTGTIREMLQDLLSKEWFRNLPIRLQAARTDLACAAADVVLVTSGTATLEVALCKRPMVISYKISPMTYALVKHKIKVPYVGLPNILLGKKVVPELLQNEATGENLAQAVLDWYRNPEEVAKLEMSFIRLHKMLLKNTDELAANAVLEEAGLLLPPAEPVNPALSNEIEAVLSSSEQHVTSSELTESAPPKPHFAEVGVVGADGKTYADHSQIPSVAHTLVHQSADMFQEVDDQQPIQPAKKQGFLARLFGRKQAAESERYAATPRLQQNEFENFDEFDELPEKKKPKAVQSPDNPNRYVLDIDDLPDAPPVTTAEAVPAMPSGNKRQPNIFDKYRQQENQPTPKPAVADSAAPKENIFSKYQNQDGTLKESVAKKDPSAKPNIFDKYRNQNSPTPEVSKPVAPATPAKTNNIFDKYRNQAEDDMESAIAQSFSHREPKLPATLGGVAKATQTAKSGNARPNIFARHQSQQQPENQVPAMDLNELIAPSAPAPVAASQSAAASGDTAKKSRPNIFARHREKHGAPPPKQEVDLNDILGEVRNETVIAIPVADDIVIPEISLNENHEDFVVVTDPNTHKPTLLSKEEWAMQQQAAQTALEHDNLGTSPVGNVDVVPMVAVAPVAAPTVDEPAVHAPELEIGQRVERILKPQRARPNEATQPILPKSSMAYKYAMMFQNTSDVRLDTEFVPTETMQPEMVAPQIEIAPQPELIAPQVEVAPQPELIAPQIEIAQQPEIVAPQVEFVAPQIEIAPQPEIVAPQVEVAPQPEFVAPQVEFVAQQPEFVAPQVEFVAPQPEFVVPQIEVVAQPEFVAPQVEFVAPQPEFIVPQVEFVAPQPEFIVPQVEFVAPQPEIVAPQVEFVAPQPEFVAPQVEFVAQQPEMVAPQVEFVAPQPEIVAPQIEIAPQPEFVAPQVEIAAQPEIVAPQVEFVAAQLEIVAPQVEVAQQPEFIAPQVEFVAQQPEFVAPQVEVAQQPEIVAPQVEFVAQQPEFVAPQVEFVAPQPELIAPQVEVAPQPELIAPQVEVAPQPEFVAPQVEIAQQSELITSQIDEESQPEIPLAEAIDELLGNALADLLEEDTEIADEEFHSWATPDIAATLLPQAISQDVIDAVEAQLATSIAPQPEMVVEPQIEVVAQPEMVVEPQVEVVAQPEMVVEPQVEVAPQPENSEPVFQHSPRFSHRYPAKAGYTAANQKLFF